MHQRFIVSNFIVTVKGCIHYFYFCHQNKIFKKLSKMLLFYQKSSFCPQDFQTFVFLSSSLLFFLGSCWFFGRSWLMINYKLIVYYMEKIAVEKCGSLKVNFCLLHWQGDSLAYFNVNHCTFCYMIHWSPRALDWG